MHRSLKPQLSFHCLLYAEVDYDPNFTLMQKTYALENLTFPKAESDQQFPRLVVVVFCLSFSMCQSDLLFSCVNQSNSYIEIDKQKITRPKIGHR